MKKPKGKKSGIKNQNKKSLARYTTKWINEGGKNNAYIVRKHDAPDKPDVPLKESAKAINAAMNANLGGVEPNVTKVDERVRAEVINIMDAPTLQRNIKPDKPDKAELKDQIEKLEQHIKSTAQVEECEFYGPPKPPDLSIISQHVPDEVIGKTSSSAVEISHEEVAANDLTNYGKIIKDVGEGMTPSGQPISAFKDGTWKPTSWVVKPEPKLHSVTSEDYTYEELAELYDMATLEIHDLKVRQKAHVDMLNDHINELGRSYTELKSRLSVEGFNAASSDSESGLRKRLSLAKKSLKDTEDALFNARQELRQHKSKNSYVSDETAIMELQTENAYLDKENSELRQEIEDLMDTVDKHQRHQVTSGKSKPPLKTLANQYYIYASQHRDDPVTNFLRRDGYDINLAKDLRQYFDKECDVRVQLSEERGWFRKLSAGAVRNWRTSCKIRRDSVWMKRMSGKHKVRQALRPQPEWWCPKLHSVTEDVYMNQIYDLRIRPKAARVNRESYCKVWSDGKYLMTHDEVIAWKKEAALEAVLKSVEGTKLFKAVAPAVRVGKFINKALNYELSSKVREQQAKEKESTTTEASRVKRLREKEFEDSFLLTKIREAQRIAH